MVSKRSTLWGFQRTLSDITRVPGQLPSDAIASPISGRVITLAIAMFAFQPLQICRVREGSPVPSCQLTSSGHVSRFQNRPGKALRSCLSIFRRYRHRSTVRQREIRPDRNRIFVVYSVKHGSLLLTERNPKVLVCYPYSDDPPQFADVLLANAAAAANQLYALIHPAFGCLGIV